MLDQATVIYVTDAGHRATAVFGELPATEERTALADLFQERPSARKHGSGMALAVPVPPKRWCVWLLPSVPKLTDLAPMLSRAQAICGGLVRIGSAGAGASKDHADPSALAARLAAPARNTAGFVSVLGEALVEAGQATGLAVFTVRRGRTAQLWTSDAAVAGVRDLIRNLVTRQVASGGALLRVTRAAESESALEAQMILESLGAQTLDLVMPSREGGYGAVVIGPADAPQGLAREVPALMQIARPLRFSRRPARSLIGVAAAISIAAFLIWPVPERITVSGSAVPAQSVVASLPADANLREMLVRVGDSVEKDQVVARFESQQLSAQLAQEALDVSVETLNAQAAMAKGDYGAYRLAQQRREIAETRRDQVQARLDQLAVTAPAAGRVIGALPPNAIGAAFPAGREVISVQTGDGFLMSLTPSRVDARRISAGMTGEALFRGLGETSFGIEVLTPPSVVRDGQNGAERLEIIARVRSGDASRLLAGLTGYARLEGDTAPRIVGMSHYLIEYLRTKAWTFLGLNW